MSRRHLFTAVAWATPVIVLSTAAPAAAAASLPLLDVQLATTALSSGGVPISLGDGKRTNSTGTDRLNKAVVLANFVVTAPGGSPVSGATVTIATDGRREDESNLVLAVSPESATAFAENSAARLSSVAVASGDGGVVRVKLSTATFRVGDCVAGTVRKTGVITVTVSKAGYTTGTRLIPYEVFDTADGGVLVACPPA